MCVSVFVSVYTQIYISVIGSHSGNKEYNI